MNKKVLGKLEVVTDPVQRVNNNFHKKILNPARFVQDFLCDLLYTIVVVESGESGDKG